MLKDFKQWAADRAEEFQEIGLRMSFHHGEPTSKSSAYLDIDSERFVARITLWVSMELQFEAMDVNSGEQVIWEYHQIRNFEELLALNSAFIDRLTGSSVLKP